MEYSNLFVVLMGLGTTFFGLTCIIFLIYLLGKLPGGEKPKSAAAPTPAAASAAAPAADKEQEKRVVAAITTSLAEFDTSPSGIRITSIKKIR